MSPSQRLVLNKGTRTGAESSPRLLIDMQTVAAIDQPYIAECAYKTLLHLRTRNHQKARMTGIFVYIHI